MSRFSFENDRFFTVRKGCVNILLRNYEGIVYNSSFDDGFQEVKTGQDVCI